MLQTAAHVIDEAHTHLHWQYLQTRYRINDGTVENEIGGVDAEFRAETFREYLRAIDYQNEAPLIRSILDASTPDDVFWDVGANVGTHSCFVGQRTSEVVAVEPHADTADRLRENYRRNGVDATVVDRALGDETGELELKIPDRFEEELGVGTFTAAADADGTTVSTVPIVRGDELVESEGLPAPTVMKIDVEGAELDVLRGCENALEQCRVVVCEIHPRFVDPDAVRDLLREHGFAIETVDRRHREEQIRAVRTDV